MQIKIIKKGIRGHIPNVLSEKVFKPLFEWDMSALYISEKITRRYRLAAEGTWVPGGDVELPCTYFCFGAKIRKRYVRNVIDESESKFIS